MMLKYFLQIGIAATLVFSNLTAIVADNVSKPNLSPIISIIGEQSSDVLRKVRLLKRELAGLNSQLITPLQTIKIYNQKLPRRGYGGADVIILQAYQLSDREFINVFLHELGHITDLGVLQNVNRTRVQKFSTFKNEGVSIAQSDESVLFYRICWQDNSRNTCTPDGFVSRYAQTSIFEDFAETFIFYVKHGKTFRQLALHNAALRAKYQFLKQRVFQGQDFQTGRVAVKIHQRVWDITKI